MKITKDKLQKLYSNMFNKDLCKLLGITNATLVSYLKRADIPLKGRGNRIKKRKIFVTV